MKERVQKTLGAQFGLRWMLWLLFAVTCMIGLIACSYAYQQRRSALLQELDLRLQPVASEYEDLADIARKQGISLREARERAEIEMKREETELEKRKENENGGRER